MNDERYYDRRADGSYIIHFPNHKGLSTDEVEEMFAKFGEVLSVDDRGKAYGLCFVRYRNLEGTKRCIEGFRNHEFISILPHKTKTKGFNKNRIPGNESKNFVQQNATKGSSEDIFTPRNLYDKQSCDNDNDQRKKNRRSDFNMSRVPSIKDNTSVNNDPTDSDHFSDTSLLSSKTVDTNKYSNKTKLMKSLETQSPAGLRKVTYDKGVQASVLIDHMPRMYDKNCDSKSFTIIPAHEVIVADIHPSVNIHYILHLFEKHNPFSVSLMRTTAKWGIRYCFVYFKTPEEVIATLREFDRYSIHGTKIIVSTLDNLIQKKY